MISSFINKLSNKLWDTTFNSDDVNVMFDSFQNIYLTIFFSSFPPNTWTQKWSWAESKGQAHDTQKKHHKSVFTTEEIWRNCIPGYKLRYVIIGTVIDFTKNCSVNFYHHILMHVCFVQWQGYSLIYSPQMLQSLSNQVWDGEDITYTRDMRNEKTNRHFILITRIIEIPWEHW
jgi:hypothetical protein